MATWTPLVKPGGDRTMILLVGLEEPFFGRVPNPRQFARLANTDRGGLVIDETDVANLGLTDDRRQVEVNGRRAEVVHVARGFSSFLGTPLVFADYPDARDYLNLPAERVSFVLGQLEPGADPKVTVSWLQQRLPDAEVWTRAEFSTQSRLYWLIQTGAGGALSLAALLGFAIGLVIVSQTIFAITVEYVDEYATLKAIGAPPALIRRVVRIQALACGGAGAALGLLAAGPAMLLARRMVTWAELPWWLYPVVLICVVGLCLLAARMAARPALEVEPGRVFRA